MKKNIKDTFEYEEELEICYDDSTTALNQCNKKWAFSKLEFSLYQEAYEYVKDLQREDNEFDVTIAKLKDHTRKQFNDFISTSKRTKSELANHPDIQNLENTHRK